MDKHGTERDAAVNGLFVVVVTLKALLSVSFNLCLLLTYLWTLRLSGVVQKGLNDIECMHGDSIEIRQRLDVQQRQLMIRITAER